MTKDRLPTISPEDLTRVAGGITLRHELWQLNNALTTTVQQQQSSASSSSQTMMMMAMAMAMRR